ncbi:MAG: hypothetical protein JOY81_01255 [Alphaproteobacteria bacterium]|nr:hypothetical protein [Alphaproteobacteria bacterium]
MSRLMSVLAALLAVTGFLATDASAQNGPPIAPAPATHPGTRINFAPAVGGATLLHGETYAGGIVTYQYMASNKVPISVALSEPEGRRLPQGADSPLLTSQFTADVADAAAQAKINGFTQFERPAVPSACTYGSVTFRCLVVSASGQRGRVFSKIMMTGYNGSYLKIRADWTQASGQTQADADQALQTFVTALLR